jgi:hypothetical protein
MKIKLRNLDAGQMVGVANCVGYYQVVRRVRKNVYLVDYKGAQIEMPRQTLTPKASN